MNLIYYFSGTGNSLRVAKALAEKLGNCKIENIANASKITEKYERIGIVTPVYCAGLPKMVFNFAKNMDFSVSKESYFFGVATYGGALGSAMQLMSNNFSENNIKLNYGNGLKMYSNYLIFYPMKSNKKEDGSVTINIEKISKDIMEKIETPIKKVNPVTNFIYNLFLKSLPYKADKYNVSEQCNGCLICKKVCPSKNIKMENNKPIFGDKCEQCVACIQWCPKEAINYKKTTQNRGRYTHPDIDVSELFLDK